eukprot:g11589.t3
MDMSDVQALEALFRSTGGENWKKKANWATDAELSTWDGVKVDEDGRVVELSISLNYHLLQGSIPEALGSLANITVLYLTDNQLTGPIPEALGSLANLEKLSLSGNQLRGPIPEALGSLANLEKLSLSGNQLRGPIPEALGSLANLEKLSLSGNQLRGTVPLSVWKLPWITKMDLAGNLLTHFTDPDDKTASTGVVLNCIERLERLRANGGFGWLITAGNPWEFPPAAVVVNGLESIRRYYDTWEQCDFSLEEIHALKVVFVGAYGAGKTSLARSIKMGRGDRTPEVDEDTKSTVGVNLHSHILRNGTECKIYDVAGQITYYGLHQFFLTERAVYVVVWDATSFEGLSGNVLDGAIEANILEWVSLLHMRTPLCTVMLVASHYDMLRGTPEENKQLLATVEERFLELHTKWKSLRHRQNSNIDERMAVLRGVFPVGCKLATESASCVEPDGLEAIDETLSKLAVVISRVPPSWVAARHVLEQVGGAHDESSGSATAVRGRPRRRPWELRSVIHAKFKSFVEEGRASVPRGAGSQHPASWLSRLHEDGIRHSMDGAIELSAFSGTVISQDVFVVLDVMWLAGVLKPILDHRGVTRNEMGDQVFANRDLITGTHLIWAGELVDRGILRRGFAHFLWSLEEQDIKSADAPCAMESAKFEEILEELGVTIPLPDPSKSPAVGEDVESSTPAATETKMQGDDDGGSSRYGADLLVIMRLPLKADAKTRENLSLARQAAALDAHESSGGGNSRLKAVFQFDHAGAPYGLPERVMALSHKIGIISPAARWRLGGLFLLKDHSNAGSVSSLILEYHKERKTLCIEALGQATQDIRAVQFVISALFHVARDFPGSSWTGWIECGMGHDGEKMYYLATSHERQNHEPGSRIIPMMRDSRRDEWSEQNNLCRRQGLERGSCTIGPDLFGRVLDVRQPFTVSEAKAKGRGLEDRDNDSSPNPQTLAKLAETMGRVERAMGRVEEGMQKSLTRLKNLQAPDYPYPHLVAVKQLPAEGLRGLRSRLRGMFVKDMTLHFLCPFDLSKVPCGHGGNGYRLRKKRGWVKKFSPALQVTLVTAKVALRAVAGVDAPGLSDFLQEFKAGSVEEVVDRSLDEDALLRVLSGDEVAGVDVQRETRASYVAITEFMKKEEADRRTKARDGDGYIDFRDSMEQVHDEQGGLVWVRTENVQKWKDSRPAAAPST